MGIFGATTVDTDLNIKVASQEIKCPTQAFAQTASLVSFPNIAADGDCLGDALRTQGKDTSKYALDINSDGSLNFRTDGYPDMKMKKKSLMAEADTCSLYEIADGSCRQSDLDCSYTKYAKAAEKALQDGTCADQGYTTKTGTQTKSYPVIGDIVISTYDKPALESAVSAVAGHYEGSVPFIIDINMIFGATTVDTDLNIKVASQEIKCPTQAFAQTASLVSFPNIAADGDCLGDALRTQGKDTSKYALDINSDGNPDMKMKKKSLMAGAVSGAYEGSVPFIIDINMDFGATTVDTDLNIKVASQEIKCPTQAYAATDSLISFPSIGTDGD